MFASKVDGVIGGSNGAPNSAGSGVGTPHMGGSYSAAASNNASGRGGGGGSAGRGSDHDLAAMESPHERKLSNSSAGNNGKVGSKSKWVNAFKSIKKTKEPADDR